MCIYDENCFDMYYAFYFELEAELTDIRCIFDKRIGKKKKKARREQQVKLHSGLATLSPPRHVLFQHYCYFQKYA